MFTLRLPDKVNLNQKLLLIYLFVFHYERFLKIESGQLNSLTSNRDLLDFNGIISRILTKKYQSIHEFPRPFNYDEARRIILENKQKLIDLLIMPEHTVCPECTELRKE